MGVARIGLAVGRQPAQGARALVVLAHLAGPAFARRSRIARQRGQLAAGGDDEAHIRILRTQRPDALKALFALALQGSLHILQACLEVIGALQVGLHHLVFGRGVQQLRLQVGNLADLRAIHQRRQRVAELLVRQPRHRDHERQQQHHVLRDLRPGDGPHAAQERAQQHPAQAQHDADLELHAREARRNQPHAIDLRHHVGERAQNSRQRCNHTRPAPAKTHMEKIGNGVQPHGPQVRRNQHGDQAEAPCPPQQIGQTTGLPWRARKALQVQRARQADEGRRTHPVGRRGHAVVHGRNAPPRHVVVLGVGRAAVHADAGVHHHGEEQKNRADPVARQPLVLGPGHQGQKTQHPRHVQRQDAVQPPQIGAVRRSAARLALSHGRGLLRPGRNAPAPRAAAGPAAQNGSWPSRKRPRSR